MKIKDVQEVAGTNLVEFSFKDKFGRTLNAGIQNDKVIIYGQGGSTSAADFETRFPEAILLIKGAVEVPEEEEEAQCDHDAEVNDAPTPEPVEEEKKSEVSGDLEESLQVNEEPALDSEVQNPAI